MSRKGTRIWIALLALALLLSAARFARTVAGPELTLSEAVERYPEQVTPLTQEEAQQRVEQGVRLFVLEDGASVAGILSAMSARRGQ